MSIRRRAVFATLVLCASIAARMTGQTAYSASRAANEAMARGAAASERKDHAAAIAEYRAALTADETLYEAALRVANAYATLRITDSAYAWYGRATVMHSDRGAAWRGWSDVLRINGRRAEALDKAIEAVVAEPYTADSKAALIAWSALTKTPLGQPAVNLPVRNRPAVRTRAMIAYDSVRLAWKGEGKGLTVRYLMEFPSASAYRHSLAEERDALRAAYRTGAADVRNLKMLDDDGMLDAYILIARPNEGIALDYPEYRAMHRDELRRFWAKYIVGWKYR